MSIQIEKFLDEKALNIFQKYKNFLKATYERALIQSDVSIYVKKYENSMKNSISNDMNENYNLLIERIKEITFQDTKTLLNNDIKSTGFYLKEGFEQGVYLAVNKTNM